MDLILLANFGLRKRLVIQGYVDVFFRHGYSNGQFQGKIYILLKMKIGLRSIPVQFKAYCLMVDDRGIFHRHPFKFKRQFGPKIELVVHHPYAQKIFPEMAEEDRGLFTVAAVDRIVGLRIDRPGVPDSLVFFQNPSQYS